MGYDGPERRADVSKLEARVRDLEEESRASSKSRALMHQQLENMNVKLDLVLSRQEDKNEDCADHRTRLALLEQSHQTLSKDVATVISDQSNATKAALLGLLAGIGALGSYIWKVTVGKGG